MGMGSSEHLRLQKVVSGGQTGVDRAALDIALLLGIPCGGWCPKGRLAEDGQISLIYPLQETPDSDYSERTAWNVRDSEGTLVLTWGAPTGGTAYTIEVARRVGRPFLLVDLAETSQPEVAAEWVCREGISILNVAGPRASKEPGIYEAARDYLRRLFGVVRAMH